MLPALAHITTWLFDLDNTLYPPEAGIMTLIEHRMSAFMARETGLPPAEAAVLQRRYYTEHGTTLAGLMKHHGVTPRRFLDDVHNVPLDNLHPDPDLNALIAALPGRKIVFSNGDDPHVTRILAKLEMTALFDGVFHLEHAGWVPKPNVKTFAAMMAAHGVDAETAAFFEDSAKNLKPAHDLGMTTILVGPKAADNVDAFVDLRSPSLKACLNDIQGVLK